MKTEARAQPIKHLLLVEELQTREELKLDAVADYAMCYAAKDGDGFAELPPVEAFDVGGDLHVINGHHRVAAAIKAGLGFVRVEVVGSGTLDEARWAAAAKNKANGVHRSSADKRRAIRMALDSAIGSEQSSRTIAEHVGVSQSLVSTMRREWEAEQVSLELSGESTEDETPDTVTGKDGRQYPKTRRTPTNGVPKKAKPASTVDDEEDERHEPDPAERYAQAARMIDRLWQKLTGLLGTDDPVCDGLRELHRCAKHEAAA